MDEVARVRAVADPVRRARMATELLAAYEDRVAALGAVRAEAVEEAHESGMTYMAVADAIGVTRGRISQIRKVRESGHDKAAPSSG